MLRCERNQNYRLFGYKVLSLLMPIQEKDKTRTEYEKQQIQNFIIYSEITIFTKLQKFTFFAFKLYPFLSFSEILIMLTETFSEFNEQLYTLISGK